MRKREPRDPALFILDGVRTRDLSAPWKRRAMTLAGMAAEARYPGPTYVNPTTIERWRCARLIEKTLTRGH